LRHTDREANDELQAPDKSGVFLCLLESEKGREDSTLFIPNLTINLTYLCYGKTKILVLREITKGKMEKKWISRGWNPYKGLAFKSIAVLKYDFYKQ
jgi:hypothetical protein